MMDGANHRIQTVFTSGLQVDLFVETFCRKFRQLLIYYILNKENIFLFFVLLIFPTIKTPVQKFCHLSCHL